MADTAHAVVLAAHTAADVARGVSRLLLGEGMTPIVEFSLPMGVAWMWPRSGLTARSSAWRSR
jgi:hypothetical protein